jgi:hypothetical protein
MIKMLENFGVSNRFLNARPLSISYPISYDYMAEEKECNKENSILIYSAGGNIYMYI